MMPVIEFQVFGEPSPQAGMRSVPVMGKNGPILDKRGRPVTRQVTTGGVNLKTWRQEMSAKAAEFCEQHGPFTGPVHIDLEFRFAMPKSRPTWSRLQRILYRTGTPDLDKIERAVGDSLKSGGLLKDDALIVSKRSRKVEVWDSWSGVKVRLRALDQRAMETAGW